MDCMGKGMSGIVLNVYFSIWESNYEIQIKRRIRQGDHMASFLFLIVVEGLTGLISQALSKNMLHGVKVGKHDVEVNILQFADDNLFVCEASYDNIFTI